MAYSYNKLRGRIIEKFGSQAAFAKALGISATTLSLKMTGQVGISQEDIDKWSKPEMLDIRVSEIGDYFFA